MANPAWTYSDWITLGSGTSARLSQLRLHIKEVSDKISTANFSTEGKSHDQDLLQQYLKDLMAAEAKEAQAAGLSAGTRSTWTRGKAAL